MNKKRKLFVLGLSSILFLGSANLYAQGSFIPRDKGFFNEVMTKSATDVTSAKASLNDWFALPKEVEWKEIERVEKGDKLRIALMPSVSGVQMDGNMVVMHFRNGQLTSMNGNVGNLGNSFSTLPELSKMVAIQNASQFINVDFALNNADASLVIRNVEGVNVLSWKVSMAGFSSKEGKFKSNVVYIDAKTGALVHQFSKINDNNVGGSGISYHYGLVDIDVFDNADDTYRLYDEERNIHTTNAGGLLNFSMMGGNQQTVDDMYPDRREIVSDSIYFGEFPTIHRIRFDALPADYLTGYSFGMSGVILPAIVVIEKDGLEADTVAFSLASNDIFSAANIAVPIQKRDFYVNIKEGLDYEIGFQKFSFNMLSGAMDIIDGFYIPLTDYSDGVHELNPAPDIEIKYWINDKMANLGVDGHYTLQTVYDFYLDRFERESYDDNGGDIHVLVDGVYGSSFTQSNAFAMPESGVVAFGVGDGQYLAPMVSLDVLGHEFQHLVTDNNGRGGLEYSKESGALNESWSDIFAKTIEFEKHPEIATWQIGKELSLVANGYMRNMEAPKNVGNALFFMMPAQPDTYLGDNWFDTSSNDDNGGVHYNSGVGNKWYYLLVEGGQGTNDHGYEYDVSPIGFDRAIEIAYGTLMDKFTPTTTYPQAYSLSLSYTAELFGEESEEYEAVQEAWFAVGLGEGGVSVNELVQEEAFRIYPNPASDYVNIENKHHQAMQIVVWDVNGREILSKTIQPGKTELNLSAIQAGVYFISMDVEGQKTVQKLVVK